MYKSPILQNNYFDFNFIYFLKHQISKTLPIHLNLVNQTVLRNIVKVLNQAFVSIYVSDKTHISTTKQPRFIIFNLSLHFVQVFILSFFIFFTSKEKNVPQ